MSHTLNLREKKSVNYFLTVFWSSEWHDNLELHSAFGDVFISIPNDPLFETMPYFVIKKLKKWLSVHDFSHEAFWHSGLQRNRWVATKTWAQSCDAKGKGPQVIGLPSRGREWQGRGGWGWRSWAQRSWPSLWPGSPPGRKLASFVK